MVENVTIMGLGFFGILFLAILQIVSTSTGEGLEQVQNYMFLMNCPPPAYDGLWNASNVTIEGYSVILNNTAGVTYGGEGAVFRCSIATLTPFPAFQVMITNKDYQATTLGFPSGAFIYFGDSMGSFFQRINNFFYLIGFYISPLNFDILGYGMEDLTGIFLAVVILVYAFCYISIGAMIYKVVSPFAGVS